MNGLLDTLAKPWMMHVIWTLGEHGEMRFGALRRAVTGISARMLTERLRELEERNFVYRTYKPTVPPEVSYGLTPRTKDIEKVMEMLHGLAAKWQKEDALAATPGADASGHAGKAGTARTARAG